MKQVAGTLRLNLAQYREMAAFAQFGSDLDRATQMQLARGERLVEILKQAQYQPLPFEKQVLIIFAANNGYVDDYPVSALRRYEQELYSYFDNRAADTLAELRDKKQIDDDVKARLIAGLDQIKKEFTA
jgi:F-type H+-transporting ATPase subunit alpha